MKSRYLFLAGPLAVAVFGTGIFGLPAMLPDYSQAQQTVSAIGAAGSPARIPFTLMLLAVAACIVAFGLGIRNAAVRAGLSPLAGYLTISLGLSAAGVGLFAQPKPLHDFFYASEVIGFQAPLALALGWRRDRHAATLVRLSWAAFVLMSAAIVLNVAMLHLEAGVWTYDGPVHGLVQKSLFLVWSAWCLAAGVVMFREDGNDPQTREIGSDGPAIAVRPEDHGGNAGTADRKT